MQVWQILHQMAEFTKQNIIQIKHIQNTVSSNDKIYRMTEALNSY